jgi:mRNA-degrading endonuclease RelE of RelBE toxin-antitoxin system
VDGRFRPVSFCSDGERRESAVIFETLQALTANDQKAAVLGLRHFVKLAQMGKPFDQLADKKTVHEAFAPFFCEVTQKNETVWRYRHGDIRILFYYAGGKLVLLADALAKRADKLSAKEKNKAKLAVKKFLEASRSEGGIQWVD